MFQDIPVDVGVIYEGERIRKPDMYVEFGGPKVDHKFELVKVRKSEEIEDGRIEVIGPDCIRYDTVLKYSWFAPLK